MRINDIFYSTLLGHNSKSQKITAGTDKAEKKKCCGKTIGDQACTFPVLIKKMFCL
jgi:hypothetical protein